MKRLKTEFALLLFAGSAWAAAPNLTELQPRGVQKGRPFVLAVVGQNLGEGVRVISTLPASFTATGNEKPGMEGRYATFLVEPSEEWRVGVYPVRVQSANGLSNILLLSVGAFPEITEEESQPNAAPNSNDSIERAQSLPSTPFTLNGTIKGPERDVYRILVKAQERRVFEVDARRAGSAIDPVITVANSAGKQVAQSEDAPLVGLDARLDVTFPKEGYYYVTVHDARFSTQAQNFYRLKSGRYDYASEIFPLGGKAGENVTVFLSGTPVKTKLPAGEKSIAFLNLPDAPTLPIPFAVGNQVELTEPVTGPIQLPVTINGRLSQPSEADKYTLQVKPGEDYIFELQARELGTSKLMGVLTVYDPEGKSLAMVGEGPLPVDVFAVQASSRTAGDPVLIFHVPEAVTQITVAVEDLAQRGGPLYGYRLHAKKAPYDFQAAINTPFVNVPEGGTMQVNFSVDRRGYAGPLDIKPVNLPEGVTFSGGHIPAEVLDPQNLNRMQSRRAMAALSAAPGMRPPLSELAFTAVGKDSDGKPIERRARGNGYMIGVAGASTQGVVDRQRALTGDWLGLELPVSIAPKLPASLQLDLINTEKKESGYEFTWRWTWITDDPMQRVPERVSVEVPNFIDLRVINTAVDPKNKMTGTFQVTSTRNTLPADYDININAELTIEGQMGKQVIYSAVHRFTLPALETEEKQTNASSAVAR
ncbi:MAG: hypothetical protein JJE04_12435 [Acidobacteriia bacterium]|nr:hypothetical protein [Terriglobia bacterium]